MSAQTRSSPRHLAWGLLLVAAGLLAGCASTKTADTSKSLVQDAQATLENFQRDPEMKWLHANMKNAKGILVSPQVWKAGFGVGGSGGNAVILARDATGGWNGPAFYKLATASVGFQAGVQSSEMVALIMTEKALSSFLSSSVKLGGDVSVAAGPIGMGAGAPVSGDVVVFTRSKGVYGGLNLEGTVVSLDDSGNRAFYGRPATPVDILVKRSVSNPASDPLVRTASLNEPSSSGK